MSFGDLFVRPSEYNAIGEQVNEDISRVRLVCQLPARVTPVRACTWACVRVRILLIPQSSRVTLLVVGILVDNNQRCCSLSVLSSQKGYWDTKKMHWILIAFWIASARLRTGAAQGYGADSDVAALTETLLNLLSSAGPPPGAPVTSQYGISSAPSSLSPSDQIDLSVYGTGAVGQQPQTLGYQRQVSETRPRVTGQTYGVYIIQPIPGQTSQPSSGYGPPVDVQPASGYGTDSSGYGVPNTNNYGVTIQVSPALLPLSAVAATTYAAQATQTSYGETVQQSDYGAPAPQPSYGAPPPQPSYGAPPPQPSYGGPPPQPSYDAPPPKPSYGAPAPQPSYGAPPPQPSYGAPAPQPSYGAPAPQSSYGAPAPQSSYGAPAPQSSYGAPAPQPRYGPPAPQPRYGAPEPQYPPPKYPAPTPHYPPPAPQYSPPQPQYPAPTPQYPPPKPKYPPPKPQYPPPKPYYPPPSPPKYPTKHHYGYPPKKPKGYGKRRHSYGYGKPKKYGYEKPEVIKIPKGYVLDFSGLNPHEKHPLPHINKLFHT